MRRALRLGLALLNLWPLAGHCAAEPAAPAPAAPRHGLPSEEAVLGPLIGAESAGLEASSSGIPESAAASAGRGFGESRRNVGVPVGRRFSAAAAPVAAANAQPARYSARGNVPGVYAAGAPAKAEDDKKAGWDYDGTVKAAGFALAGAVLGFMLGGPIGAAAGFLAGFFIGAMVWKAGQR